MPRRHVLPSGEPPKRRPPVPPAITRQERAVLIGVCWGLTNKEIATLIDRSEDTVRMHLKKLTDKLVANEHGGRTRLVMTALRRGWITLEEAGLEMAIKGRTE